MQELRDYEVVYIIRPDIDEASRREKIEAIKEAVVAHGGEVREVDEWGTRILAYEIDGFREGYYVLMTFTLPPNEVTAFEDRLKVDEGLLRYQIIRLDKE